MGRTETQVPILSSTKAPQPQPLRLRIPRNNRIQIDRQCRRRAWVTVTVTGSFEGVGGGSLSNGREKRKELRPGCKEGPLNGR